MTRDEFDTRLTRLEGQLDIVIRELLSLNESYENEKAAIWHRGYSAGRQAAQRNRSKPRGPNKRIRSEVELEAA